MAAATSPPLPPVVTVAETGSTQRDLLAVAADAAAWPHLSGIRAVRQSAGEGRRGRRWDTAGVTALTVSLVVRPEAAPTPVPLPWLPVLAGAAVADAVRECGAAAALKWPNDVVLPAETEHAGWGPWRKVAGVLADGLPGGGAVVVGIGVNLDGEPPVGWATTLAAAGVRVEAEVLLEAVRARLDARLLSDPARWPRDIGAVCTSVGSRVRAGLPGGREVVGEAVGLAGSGALRVRDGDGVEHAVMAGEIEHLRTGGRGVG